LSVINCDPTSSSVPEKDFKKNWRNPVERTELLAFRRNLNYVALLKVSYSLVDVHERVNTSLDVDDNAATNPSLIE